MSLKNSRSKTVNQGMFYTITAIVETIFPR